MITIITDEKQIKLLQNKFRHQLDRFLTQEINCWIGYHGGSFNSNALYSEEFNIWSCYRKDNKRQVNLFGIGKPIEGKMNSITTQINFPHDKINRRVAGVFAIEDNNNILVLHRGKIGGGKIGVGKNLVIENFRGDFVKAIDGNRETEFCLIGELNSPLLPKQVANFVHEIERIKQLEVGAVETNFEELNDFNYTEEFSGQSVTERNESIVINRIHGLVVNALATELESRGYQIANDKNRDLFIHKGKQILVLFEVKTSSSTQCLYSAVGQLIIYSIPINDTVDLVVVLPDKLSKKVIDKLNSLGIKPLYYQWINDEIEFNGIEDVLRNN